ncbi:hypothetical protein RP20_CCG002794 [Aedes albopictus]|nr:hypothetical protein RP20_CCG002794 [Aedes albopictus]
MESTIRRIELLEEQSLLRRKQYEEKKQRIEEEYQRELVRIDEEFRQAARKIELKFAARRGESTYERQQSDALPERCSVAVNVLRGITVAADSNEEKKFDHIDVKECRDRGIRIGYTPEVLTDATAELTVALLLATARRLFEANREAHTGGWKSWSPMWMCGTSIKNSVVGIFGFGRIGQEVAKRIAPFKPAQIQFTSRTDKCLTAEELGATQVPFDELIETSDFIIIACSYTMETANLFNDSVFSRMKPSAILINTSRGGVVEQHDLIHALKAGKIQAAGLDVTTPEPLPLDSPLLQMSNVVVLPHIGSADVETRTEMSRITACNILAGLKGVKMISEV